MTCLPTRGRSFWLFKTSHSLWASFSGSGHVLGLSASFPTSGILKISVIDGSLTLAGTLGSRDGVTLDVASGGLVDLETQSDAGLLVVDGNIRSAAQSVDAYSHQALVFNQGLRSSLPDSIREQGPRN